MEASNSSMGLPLRDNERHTYADYAKWPEDVRYELIDGIAYLMAPAPVRRHQEIAFAIARQVADALEGKPWRAYVAPFDVRLPKGDEPDDDIDTVVQPDVLVVCDRSKLDERGMRGAPDWVAEVLSPGTASHDQTVKLGAYERAGVPEVWLVHPTDLVVTVYLLQGGTYGRPAIHEMKGELAAATLPRHSHRLGASPRRALSVEPGLNQQRGHSCRWLKSVGGKNLPPTRSASSCPARAWRPLADAYLDGCIIGCPLHQFR